MQLIDALRSTATVRDFTDRPVGDDALVTILDTARFAPSGGNNQGWHVVVLRDPDVRRSMRDLYCSGWSDYLAMRRAGLTPWSPLADRAEEDAAIAAASDSEVALPLGGFADQLHRVPALLAVFVDLHALAAVDRDLDRYTIAGGASIYPFVWNILLAARAEGLGGVITTMPIRREPEVRELLGVPRHHALATLVALGHPVAAPSRLRRRPVAEFATVDRFEGAPLA